MSSSASKRLSAVVRRRRTVSVMDAEEQLGKYIELTDYPQPSQPKRLNQRQFLSSKATEVGNFMVSMAMAMPRVRFFSI